VTIRCVGKIGNWGAVEWEDGVYPQLGDKLYSGELGSISDEKIMQLYEEFIETQYASESNVLGFGRAIEAILKKVREK
jgi:hypothetical protein